MKDSREPIPQFCPFCGCYAFIGVELDPHHFDTAVRRIKAAWTIRQEQAAKVAA